MVAAAAMLRRLGVMCGREREREKEREKAITRKTVVQ